MIAKTLWYVAAFAVLSAPTVALADDPAVQPVQVGAETVRYVQGTATVDLRQARGVVQISPLPLDHGSLAFSVAVFNGSDRPVNIDLGNFSAQAGTQQLALLSADQLVSKAKNRATWRKIGIALVAGIGAGAAASQRDTYYSSVHTRFGSAYSYYSAPSLAGQLQADLIMAGAAYSLVKVQDQLDRTRAAIGNTVVQTTTLNPGDSYAGKIILEKVRELRLPQQVRVTVVWNGEAYPFAFQVAKQGTPAPQFTAITPPEVSSDRPGPASFVQTSAQAVRPVYGLQQQRPAPAPASNLAFLVRRTAELMPRPTVLDDGSTITKFEAAGNELILAAAIDTAATAEPQAAAQRSICSQRAIVPLLRQGATVRAVLVDRRGRKAGEILLNGPECGFY